VESIAISVGISDGSAAVGVAGEPPQAVNMTARKKIQSIRYAFFIFYLLVYKKFFYGNLKYDQTFNWIFDLSQQGFDLFFVSRRIERDLNTLCFQVCPSGPNTFQFL